MGSASLFCTPRRALAGALGGLLAALPLASYLRGFTVDDALIPARYAHHLARGLGYRFNLHGPTTDGVTPLGFAYLLAPFAQNSVLSAWTASRWLGRGAWLVAAAALGMRIAGVATRSESSAAARRTGELPAGAGPDSCVRWLALLLIACSAPLAAWCSAGLETPLVIATATLAAVLAPTPSRALLGAGAAGLCASLRPEMLPFAAVLAWARARTAVTRARAVACVALGAGPWLLVAAIRWTVWGRPAPLAILAKPSDLTHGLSYVLPAVLFTGAPWVATAPWGWRRLSSWSRALTAAGFVHLVVVALAGGDWMPLARLVCPVLPAFVLVSAELLHDARTRRWAFVRLLSGCAAQLIVLRLRGEAARGVADDRLALIDWARPRLARAGTIATVDVGWVGAATEAEIIDLAGATDAEIAALPGGHTSKWVGAEYLLGRRPDVLLFQLASAKLASQAPERWTFARLIEQRLATDPAIRRNYAPAALSPAELPIVYAELQRDGDPTSTPWSSSPP